MKSSNGPPARRRPPTALRHRTRLLAAFDRSGLSAAAFARQRGIRYTTFCGWCQRRARPPAAPAFVQVAVAEPPASAELRIELGAHAHVRLTSVSQIELAVRLLQGLNAPTAC